MHKFKLKFCHINNFGDQLNIDLLKHYNIPFTKQYQGQGNLLLLGSIMESCPDNSDTIVAGVGLMFEKSNIYLKHTKILSVRGKLTSDRIKSQPIKYFFDPGILAMKLYPKKPTQYKLGIIPHFVDFNHPDIELLKKNRHVNVINVRQSPEKVCLEISKCSHVVSSSLHGIIVAESYDIPAAWWNLSEKVLGNGFKFRDYVSAYNDNELKSYFKIENQVKISDLIASCKNPRKGVKQKIIIADMIMKSLAKKRKTNAIVIYFTPFVRRIYTKIKKIKYDY